MTARQGSKNGLCGGRSRKTGALCKRPAGWGTDHPGTGKCKLHGGCSKGPPKGSQNNFKHGLYARLFPADLLEQAAAMRGSIAAELDIARIQLSIVIEKLQANNLDVTKVEIKTLALEEADGKGEAKRAKRIEREAERFGEYYDPDDGDFGIVQESQPVEVKKVRELRDWLQDFFRLTSLVARLEQQLQQAERHSVDLKLAKKQLERENSADGGGDAKQLTSTELDAAILGAIRGFSTGVSGRAGHSGQAQAAGPVDGVPDEG